jgi:hypothetical protein
MLMCLHCSLISSIRRHFAAFTPSDSWPGKPKKEKLHRLYHAECTAPPADEYMPPEHETLPSECALTASSPLPEGSSCNVACKPGTAKVWIVAEGD